MFRRILLFLSTISFLFLLFSCEQKEEVETTMPWKVVMIIPHKDFHDEELQEPKNLLEKQGAKVTLASSEHGTATGDLGTEVTPDILLENVKVADYDAVIFVGGPGASEYQDNAKAHAIASAAAPAGKLLCAICIAPTTLANAGVLQGKKATAYSSEADKLKAKGAVYTGVDVEVDGKIITADCARANPGAAGKFAEGIVKALQ